MSIKSVKELCSFLALYAAWTFGLHQNKIEYLDNNACTTLCNDISAV
jgi:hypothetical protein